MAQFCENCVNCVGSNVPLAFPVDHWTHLGETFPNLSHPRRRLWVFRSVASLIPSGLRNGRSDTWERKICKWPFWLVQHILGNRIAFRFLPLSRLQKLFGPAHLVLNSTPAETEHFNLILLLAFQKADGTIWVDRIKGEHFSYDSPADDVRTEASTATSHISAILKWRIRLDE